MEKMFQRAHKAGIKILIAGCFGNEDCDRPIDFNKAGLPLDDYAAGIAQIERRLAKRYGARRLPDLQETIRPNTRKEFWSDSNHPNAAGNREVANLLIPLINEISDDK